jgi:lipid A 3-O-deacylase
MIRKIALAAVLALGAISNAHALDGVSFEVGEGDQDTELWRVGVQWSWRKRWFTNRTWTLGAYWDLQAGRWSAPLQPGEPGLWDIGITPVFRLERAARTPVVPYVEAAVGFHFLSERRVNSERVFSSVFQFGDHLGAGIRFGPDQRYDASVRFQHLSNGGLVQPNPGINFVQLRLAYHF